MIRELIVVLLGRKTAYRLGRGLYMYSRGDVANDMDSNGERTVQECVIDALRRSALDERVVVFDVGANIGYYSLLARKRLGSNGMVVAFEPIPLLYEKLLKNLEGVAYLGGVHGVTAYQYAVSEKKCHAALSIPKGAESNDGIATLQECIGALDHLKVQTITLDEVIDKEVCLIKIDVEGNEYAAFLGPRSLLARVMLRNFSFEDHDVDNSNVIGLLSDYGYKIFSIGWDLNSLFLKPLGEANKSLVSDAPNYIATLDVRNLESAIGTVGWNVLHGC